MRYRGGPVNSRIYFHPVDFIGSVIIIDHRPFLGTTIGRIPRTHVTFIPSLLGGKARGVNSQIA